MRMNNQCGEKVAFGMSYPVHCLQQSHYLNNLSLLVCIDSPEDVCVASFPGCQSSFWKRQSQNLGRRDQRQAFEVVEYIFPNLPKLK